MHDKYLINLFSDVLYSKYTIFDSINKIQIYSSVIYNLLHTVMHELILK